MTLDLPIIVAVFSILGTLAVAGRLVFRTEAKVEHLEAEIVRVAGHTADCDKAITHFRMDHGTSATATSKDVEALKRDLERLAEALAGGLSDVRGEIRALAVAVRSRSKDPRDSG